MTASSILTDNILSFWMKRVQNPEGGFFGRIDGEGKLHPEATELGIDFGLYMQERTSTYGQSYQIVMYSQKAQEFIAAHLEQIVNNNI